MNNEVSIVKNESYYSICGWMINKLELKGVALSIYAIIYGFSQDGESAFRGSRRYLCDFTGVTLPTIDKALTELVNRELVSKRIEHEGGVKKVSYRANLDALNDVSPCKETLQGGVKKLYRG